MDSPSGDRLRAIEALEEFANEHSKSVGARNDSIRVVEFLPEPSPKNWDANDAGSAESAASMLAFF
jgi:hypothetical protein